MNENKMVGLLRYWIQSWFKILAKRRAVPFAKLMPWTVRIWAMLLTELGAGLKFNYVTKYEQVLVQIGQTTIFNEQWFVELQRYIVDQQERLLI